MFILTIFNETMKNSPFQALGWQNVAAKIGMQRCVTSSQWLNERITLSRYAHVISFLLSPCQYGLIKKVLNVNVSNCLILQVPIGNFDVDWLMHTADIFFSRALRDQQQVVSFILHAISLLDDEFNLSDYI